MQGNGLMNVLVIAGGIAGEWFDERVGHPTSSRKEMTCEVSISLKIAIDFFSSVARVFGARGGLKKFQ